MLPHTRNQTFQSFFSQRRKMLHKKMLHKGTELFFFLRTEHILKANNGGKREDKGK
jgi:hypothetical protein